MCGNDQLDAAHSRLGTGQPGKAREMTLNISEGTVVPDFELKSLTGELVKLSDYRGKRLVIFFWASW